MATDCLKSAASFSGSATPSWWTRLAKFIARLKTRDEARAGRGIDAWFRREREARERFLARAGDRFELERLERDFDRRYWDYWRV